MYKMYKTYAYYIITKAVAVGVRRNTVPIYMHTYTVYATTTLGLSAIYL